MHRIFKYQLQAEGRQILQLPKGARPLSIINQGELPMLYALVDDAQPPEARIFRLVTTGEEFNGDGCEFIGTVVLQGWFVGHVFEQFELGQSDSVSPRFASDFAEARRAVDGAELVPAL